MIKLECPSIVREEFNDSQVGVEETEDEIPGVSNGEEDLHIEPEPVHQDYIQEQWMEALKPIHENEQQFYEGENDYDDLEIQAAANQVDWYQDARSLKLSLEDLEEMPKWLENQKNSFKIPVEMSEEDEIASKINQLNEKQMAAFSIVKNFIEEVTFISLLQKTINSVWLKYTFVVTNFLLVLSVLETVANIIIWK